MRSTHSDGFGEHDTLMRFETQPDGTGQRRISLGLACEIRRGFSEDVSFFLDPAQLRFQSGYFGFQFLILPLRR